MSDAVEYRDSQFTGHLECETGALAIGFQLRTTVKVLPGEVTEVRLVISEPDALSLARGIMDVLQGLAHDRIIAMRTVFVSEPGDCHWCGRNDNAGVIFDRNGDRFPYCHRHEDEVRSMIEDTLTEEG